MSNWYHYAQIDVTDPATVVVSGGATASGEERICLSLPGREIRGDGWDLSRAQNKDLNVVALTLEVARIIWEGLDSRFAPERAREWAAAMRTAGAAAAERPARGGRRAMTSGRCHDCGAAPGELHDLGCDVEVCPICGMQLISCGHDEAEGSRILWDGEGTLHRAAKRYDFWCVPDERRGWIPCPPGKPGATLDLNRVYCDCRWDATTGEWVKR